MFFFHDVAFSVCGFWNSAMGSCVSSEHLMNDLEIEWTEKRAEGECERNTIETERNKK